VLQDAEFTKLGSNKKITVDVRVVTATNRDLEQMMVRGDFREDLYYRLKVIEAYVPPLRERRDEIPKLTDFFLAKYSQRYNRPVRSLSDELRQRFLSYEWPGNVRELENMIKRFVILQDESLVMRELNKPRLVANPPPMEPGAPAFHAPPPQVVAPPPPQAVAAPPPAAAPVESDAADEEADNVPPPSGSDGRRLSDVAREAALSAERTVIADTLRQVHWNRRKAAQLLGVSYKTLLNKIKETGIERP
jgi:two-component system response regulator AtoC